MPARVPRGGGGNRRERAAVAAADAAAASAAAEKDPSKFSGKKSKAAAKKGTGATQWEIMKLSGIAEADIPAFKDPAHWLKFFPPLAKRDISLMGCGVDWRRSFITTDANPFYDSFVRWQFNSLRKAGKVVKDKRAAVFSPKDGQPCADHDRASGEGVGPQEYCLVKMRVQTEKLLLLLSKEKKKTKAAAPPPAAASPPSRLSSRSPTRAPHLPAGGHAEARDDVRADQLLGAARRASTESTRGPRLFPFFALATTRALQTATETLLLPLLLLLSTSWEARRPQHGLPGPPRLGPDPNPTPIKVVTGQELLGTPALGAARAARTLFVLPLLTISMTKGTGVVTSVPSDSPDDFAALRDLKQKPALRTKYGVKDEW